MKNRIQQCPKCYSMELPSSIYCSQCATKLNGSQYDFSAQNNKSKSPRLFYQIGIAAIGLFLLSFIVLVALSSRPKSTELSTATTQSYQPTPTAPIAQYISTSENAAITIEGKVVGIYDGDTCTVLDSSNKQHKIRLAGIDAPEIAQDFGNKAKENLSNLIFGKTVQVISDKKDKYGRTVGKILLDGKDINLEQLKAGFAWHYKEYQNEQSEEDRKLYAGVETESRNLKIGLWSLPNPIAPWAYRRGDNIPPEDADKFFGNKNSFIYHWAGCPGFNKIGEKNRVIFNSAEEAEAEGYRPARNCTKPKPESESLTEENSESFQVVIENKGDSPKPYLAPIEVETIPAPITARQPTPEAYEQRNETPTYPRYERPLTQNSTTSITATARCADGTLSYSANRQGTCSHHGGVAEWFDGSTPSRNKTLDSYTPSYPGSDSTYRPKTVHVDGYFRKDGTYVRPHTRSAPRRRN